MTTQPWSERPEEEANLLNPAFCSLLIRSTARDYRSATKTSLPFALSFLILPVVLHKPTRDALPSTTATLMTAWAVANPAVLAGFGQRAQRFVESTREAILFGAGHGWLKFNGLGLVPGPKRLGGDPANLPSNTAEVGSCFAASRLLGRWLASAGTTATVMSIWGVAP